MNVSSSGVSTCLINELSDKLGQDHPVNCKLPGGGRLYIDRCLPQLCVARLPKEDSDTGRLLHGQAAYLVLDSTIEVGALLHAIVQRQSSRLGGFLIIEIWLDEQKVSDRDHYPHPGFHVHALRHGNVDDVVHTLARDLGKIQLRKNVADVKVSFDSQCAPSGLNPLLDDDELALLACSLIGVEISPVHLDESGATLPDAFRALRRGMTHALKTASYRFSRQHTPYRPRHYHELGPRALTRTVWEADRRLAEISDEFDLLLHVTPVNARECWLEFKNSRFQESPNFHYRRSRVDPALLKRELFSIPLERVGDPALEGMLTEKRDELDRQLSLLRDRNSEAFLPGSLQLFGAPDPTLVQTAKDLIARVPANEQNESEQLTAFQFAEIAREELAHYQQIDPALNSRVEVRDDISGILVSRGDFLIGTDARVSTRRVAATLNHEIGTHVLTYHNGKKQPLQQLHAGMAGYEELQEGLAVLAEYLSAGLSPSRLQLLAGRVIAVDSIYRGDSFLQCFHLLRQHYNFRPFTAFNLTMRVYRGGGYTKDVIYLRGLVRLLHYICGNEELDLLYCGKIALEHLDFLEELRWREVLKPLALQPRYLRDADAARRLQALRLNPTLTNMLNNA